MSHVNSSGDLLQNLSSFARISSLTHVRNFKAGATSPFDLKASLSSFSGIDWLFFIP
nr:MAG TPA: hypothetical protein [Caudoviricetes sp.]